MSKIIFKAQDYQLGTKFQMEYYTSIDKVRNYDNLSKCFIPVTLVGYSKQGDEVGILEDDNGTVFVKNVNDLYPSDYINPIIGFIQHITDAINNSKTQKYNLNVNAKGETLFIKNEFDGSSFQVEVRKII